MKDKHDSNRTVVTVFGLLIHQGKVLMIRRANEPYRDLCTIPGGHKQHGESLKEACCREMLEETGLAVKNPTLLGLIEVEIIGDPRDFISFYFACPAWEGTLTPGPEGELFWVDQKIAPQLPEVHPAFRSLAPYFFKPEKPFLARAIVDSSGQGQYQVNGF